MWLLRCHEIAADPRGSSISSSSICLVARRLLVRVMVGR
jgi:hypothetical protein